MKVKVRDIITAYTGIFCGDMDGFHKYAEALMNRPVFTHEFGTGSVMDAIKEKSKPDFSLAIQKIGDMEIDSCKEAS